MIQLNHIVESAILSALDLDIRSIRPLGVRYMMDNGCPMFVMFYDGRTLPKSEKYHRMRTSTGGKAIAITCDILGSKYEDDKQFLDYIDNYDSK